MARKPSKKTLNAALDRLWSVQVRARANLQCERCGKPATQAHHVVGRVNRRLRWNLRNGWSCDGGCHMWAEQNPLAFAVFFKRQRPDDFAYLTDPENSRPLNRSIADLEDLRDSMKDAA